MTPEVLAIGTAMYGALANLPCSCAHNVPYGGCATPQLVTKQCKRCESMSRWEALVLGEAS